MAAGIIVIAMTHGMVLTPALLGECRFIYHGTGHQDQVTRTVVSGEKGNRSEEDQQFPKRERQVFPSRTSLIGMVKKASSIRANDGGKWQLKDESESEND